MRFDETRLAETIAARVAEKLLGPPETVTVSAVDPEVLEAADGVSDAMTNLDNEKGTRGEMRARLLLEKRAQALRLVMRARKGGTHG